MRKHRPVDRMAADYRCGDSLVAIAVRYQTPRTTTRRLLINAGVLFRRQGRGNHCSDLHQAHDHRYTTEMETKP